MVTRLWISVAVMLVIIGVASAVLFLTAPPSLNPSTSSPHVEMQLNPPLSVAWEFGYLSPGAEYGPFFNQIADESVVYATAGKPASGSAVLIAISLASGNALWELKILGSPDAKGSGLSFLNNDSSTHTLVVGVAGALLGVDDVSGKALWSVNGSWGFPLASPDGRVYTAVGAFWGNNGSKICSYQGPPAQGETGGWILAYGGGRIYSMIGADRLKGEILAFDAHSCKQLWTTLLGPKGNHWASYWSVYRNDRVYAADDHSLYSIDAASGSIVWNVTHGLGNFWPPTVSGGAVYLSGWAGVDNISGWKSTEGVEAFNATNGQLLWRSTPVVADGTMRPGVSGKLVYAALGCTLSALDSRTGKAMWKWSLDNCNGPGFYSYYGPLIVSSYLLLTNDVSYLIAFRGNLLASG